MSSWLVRLASGLTFKLQTFTSRTLKQKSGFWGNDVDKRPSSDLLRRLSLGTGVSLERAEQTGLNQYEGVLWPKYKHNGPLTWVLPIRRDGRYRLGYGQQFCPQCLAEDKIPYFRRKWRLAFLVTCEKHHCYLSDACLTCGAPVVFHTHDFGSQRWLYDTLMLRCHRCLIGLHLPPRWVLAEKPPAELLYFQAALHKALRLGYSNDLPGGSCYAHLYFEGMRQLVRLLISEGRPARLRDRMQHDSGRLPLGVSTKRSRPVFEELRLGDRATTLVMCARLIDDWPQNFVELCQQSKLSSSYIVRYGIDMPYWLSSVLKLFLNDQDYAPNKDERAAVMRYLERRGLDTSENAVRKWLGLSHTSRSSRSRLHLWNPRGPRQ